MFQATLDRSQGSSHPHPYPDEVRKKIQKSYFAFLAITVGLCKAFHRFHSWDAQWLTKAMFIHSALYLTILCGLSAQPEWGVNLANWVPWDGEPVWVAARLQGLHRPGTQCTTHGWLNAVLQVWFVHFIHLDTKAAYWQSPRVATCYEIQEMPHLAQSNAWDPVKCAAILVLAD